jgi:hypothetical protein
MTTGNSGDKLSLQKRLAVFLNIDSEDDQDYVTDVLEQLIDIGEDIDDVTAYLSSFLGGDDSSDDNDSLREFARDVRRFKLGEEIVEPIVDTATASYEKQSGQENEIQQHHLQQRQRKNNGEAEKNTQPTVSQVRRVQPSPIAKDKQEQEGQQTLKPTKNIDVQSLSKSDQSMPQPSKSSNSNKATKQKQQSPQPPQKLKKGKAKKVCGCYGNKHKPLTNCLHCGRISCEAEGYDFCPFCHILIEDFSKRVQQQSCSNSASSSSALALLHKERLLEFDRTAAARTKILDDQEDYFISSNSMWSTQAEQDDAKEKEEERRRKLHERQKQVLNINF